MQTFLIVIAATLSLSLPNLTFAQNKSLKKNQASVSSKMNTKNGQSLNKLETLVPPTNERQRCRGVICDTYQKW